MIIIDGILNTYHWQEKRGRSRCQWYCIYKHGWKTSIHHTIFFLHCSVVTQEELEHRLLDHLSEKLQASEAQLREEMAKQEGEWWYHHY